MLSVAVVILNYNTSYDCVKCVSFLKRQGGVKYEIIVVDNCSSQEDVKQIEVLCKNENCTLLKSPVNRGYSAGNNIGLRYAAEKGYEYALVTNPDMEFPQLEYLASLVSKIEEDKQIVVIASDIVGYNGVHQNPMLGDSADWRSEWGWIKEFIRVPINRNKHLCFVADYTRSGYCEKLSGCCFMMRLDFLRKIGFLDEHTFLYCEEPVLARQVRQAGLKMYYTADIQAVHRHVPSAKGNSWKRWQAFFPSRRYYLRAYSEITGWRLQLALFSLTLQRCVYWGWYKWKR